MCGSDKQPDGYYECGSDKQPEGTMTDKQPEGTMNVSSDKQPEGMNVDVHKLTGSTVSGAPGATAAGYDTVTVRPRGSGL